jgi:hypothetical protein
LTRPANFLIFLVRPTRPVLLVEDVYGKLLKQRESAVE